jgi:hypothetical protein
MSLFLPKSKSQMLYDAACQLISKAKPVRADWDFVAYDTYSGSINTPFIEIGGGYSYGSLSVKKQGQSQANKLRCITSDLSAGLGPSPINAGFPVPTLQSAGIIYKLPSFVSMEVTLNSFRAGYFAINQSVQTGVSGALTYLIFLPKFVPNMNLLSPQIILTAGVFIAIAGLAGGLCPDAGVTCSLGCAI